MLAANVQIINLSLSTVHTKGLVHFNEFGEKTG